MTKKIISVALILCLIFSTWVTHSVSAENVATVTVTFVNGNTVSEEKVTVGAYIPYPSLTSSFNYDHVWSLEQNGFSAVPETAKQDITVYAYKSPVISFENYPVYKGNSNLSVYKPAVNYDFEFNAMTSSEFAYSGKSSLKLQNIGLQLLETEPGITDSVSGDFTSSWEEDCKAGKYYKFDPSLNRWVKITQDNIPEFVPYTYARKRISVETGNIPIRSFEKTEIPVSFKYKITFKYLATENNTEKSTLNARIFASSNLWWGTKAIIGTFTFPAGASNGWQTGEMYVEASDAFIEKFSTYQHVLDLNWTGAGTKEQMPRYSNEIYIDDIKIEENYQNDLKLTLHDGENVTEITKGLTHGAVYSLPVPEAEDGKYFMGWYYSSNPASFISSLTLPSETQLCDIHLYAKYGDFPDGEVYNQQNGGIIPLKGYAYESDGEYKGIALNEKTWGYKGYCEDGIVLGKDYTGAAYKWNPELNGTNGEHSQNSNRDDIIAHTADLPVGENTNVGWGESVNYVLRDQYGNAVVAKPNTTYAIGVKYKKLSEGNLIFGAAIGRKAEFVSTASDAYVSKSYNRFVCTIDRSVTGEPITGEYDTATFYVTTREFSEGDIPVISIHSYYSGYYAKRLDADQNGVSSYTLSNGTTYYPYRIISAPQIAITEVTVLEVENGNCAITYNTYKKGEGFSLLLKEHKPNTPLDPTNNLDPYWYDSKYATTKGFNSVPQYHLSCYNADYYMANPDSISCTMFGNRLRSAVIDKDGNPLPAIKYSSNEATGVEDNQVLRIKKVAKGHTYKLTFSLYAEELNADLSVSLTTADYKNVNIGNNPLCSKKVTASANEWTTVTYYFTPDPTGIILDTSESGVDYYLDNDCYYLYLQLTQTKAELNTVYIADLNLVDLGEVITYGGASVLTDSAANASNNQAIRHYFSYETVNGDDITIDGKTFKVVERGFIYRDGKVNLSGKTVREKSSFYANAEEKKGAFTKTKITENFNSCWAYSDGVLTFSTYVKDFSINNDTRKLQIKAYLIIEDQNGERFVIHSPSSSRTVDGIKNGSNANDGPLRGRKLIWSEEFNVSSINEITSFSQNFDTMFSRTENLVTSTSEENYFIDSDKGELVLRTTSDGNRNYKTPKSVTTRQIMSYRYGYLEMRAKIPYMKCAWPGFWMQPDKAAWNASRYNGEIDIFEVFGSETDTVCNLHKWYTKSDGTGTSDQISNKGHYLYGSRTNSFMNEEEGEKYHTYGFEWTPEFMAFYIDGKMYCKIDITDQTGDFSKERPGMDCFRRYFYISLNNWVFTEQQSNWVDADNLVENNPDLGSIDYRIDYMRLYQGADEDICLY